MLAVHFIEVSDIGHGAFLELASEEDIKLTLSRCMNVTYDIFGHVLGMCSSSVSVS